VLSRLRHTVDTTLNIVGALNLDVLALGIKVLNYSVPRLPRDRTGITAGDTELGPRKSL
jgi:hypothetical protein